VAPNPFNPATTFHFELPQTAAVRLEVYDAAGRRVRTLVSATLGAGTHRARWNGRNDAGAVVRSGAYFVRLQAGALVARTKTVLIE
jgi:flagellar hook assembly protein FlgD